MTLSSLWPQSVFTNCFLYLRTLGRPTWNCGGSGGLCTALSPNTPACWLSMDIIHTYKMIEVRTTFPIRNLS